MSSSVLQKFAQKFCKPKVPDLRPGQVVRVHQKIKEGGKERTQVFQGTVTALNAGFGPDATFTVRKISGGIGVEKVFPIHSPNIIKIEVTRTQKVRRAKLNFLRKLSGKALRLKEIEFNLREKEFEVPEPPTKEEKTEESVVKEPAKEEDKTKEETKAEEKVEKKEVVEVTTEKVEEKEEGKALDKATSTKEKPAEEVKEEVKAEPAAEAKDKEKAEKLAEESKRKEEEEEKKAK